ncbi:MAG: glycosyltransferase [Thermoanaerobaculia bacterium]|nr:glycosyltransferase [Thermoanaerobaculia bacterium]
MEPSVASEPPLAPSLLFVLPVYDDWTVLASLLVDLDTMVSAEGLDAEILVVDDGSRSSVEDSSLADVLRGNRKSALTRLRVLELRRNLGHQRALALALAWVHEEMPDRTLIILDADGEDDPDDVPRLLRRYQQEDCQKVVFAARRKRSENWRFQLFYRVYQILHRLLTGSDIRVGNFSVVPPRAVARLVVTSETWSHYAAAVAVSRVPRCEVATDRAQRLDGRSKMSFTSLVVHGLSALSVYSHVIGVRLLLSVAGVLAISGGTVAAYVLSFGVPDWASAPMLALLASIWLLILLQTLAAGILFVFILLSGRQSASVLPLRDYQLFVRRVAEVPVAGSVS